jgi:hypothetical protein
MRRRVRGGEGRGGGGSGGGAGLGERGHHATQTLREYEDRQGAGETLCIQTLCQSYRHLRTTGFV